MVRNGLKMLVCLLLAVMIPLGALADVQHTFKIDPGDALGTGSAVADLLKVLSLRYTQGSKSGALTIELEDEAIASVALAADATGLYVHSGLLSDDVLYVTWDDGFAYLTEFSKEQLRAEGAAESDLAAIESSMAVVKNSIVTAMSSDFSYPSSSVTVSYAEDLTQVAQMFPGDEALQEYAASVFEKMSVEKGAFTDEYRDTADEKYTLTMDEQDILKLCDTDYMRTLMREMTAMAEPELQGDALEKATDEMLDSVRQLYRDGEYDLTMNMYTQDGGTALVGMDALMNMQLSDGSETVSTAMNLAYGRRTDESGVAHKADLSVAVDGAQAMQLAFDLHRGVNEVSEGSVALLADGEEITIQYKAENTQPDVRERSASLYLRSGASAIITPSASDRPIVNFRVTTEPADPALLASIEKADAHNSVNVMKLSAEEMQTLGTDIVTRSMQALYSALAKLPTSVLQLVMQLAQ